MKYLTNNLLNWKFTCISIKWKHFVFAHMSVVKYCTYIGFALILGCTYWVVRKRGGRLCRRGRWGEGGGREESETWRWEGGRVLFNCLMNFYDLATSGTGLFHVTNWDCHSQVHWFSEIKYCVTLTSVSSPHDVAFIVITEIRGCRQLCAEHAWKLKAVQCSWKFVCIHTCHLCFSVWEREREWVSVRACARACARTCVCVCVCVSEIFAPHQGV